MLWFTLYVVGVINFFIIMFLIILELIFFIKDVNFILKGKF